MEMTNDAFIINSETQRCIDRLRNASADSESKPDIAYGYKVLRHYAFEEMLESIPVLNEDGENFDEWLEAIESLKAKNGLLNSVLIPEACDENNIEIAGIRIAVERVFARRLHNTILDADLLEAIRKLSCSDKMEWISIVYRNTGRQKMRKYVRKAYESNLIPEGITSMKEIFQNRIVAMMETKSNYASVLLTTYFLGTAFQYLDDKGEQPRSAKNIKAILAELDNDVPKEVNAIIEEQINVRLRMLKEFCDVPDHFTSDNPVRLKGNQTGTALIATSKKNKRRKVIPKKYRKLAAHLNKDTAKYKVECKLPLDTLLSLLDNKFCPVCSATNVDFKTHPCNK